MKVSRSLVDCSVHSETHSHQRVGRELVSEMVKYYYYNAAIHYLPVIFSCELSLETLLSTVHV